MAKIGEKIFDFKDVLKSSKVPVSCAADQWFLNVGRNSVVNVRDQKTVHTWTLAHPHYFTDSVVYSSGNLYCVMNKKVLLKWSIDEDNLKNAEKIEFQESIFTVIAFNNSEQLILFDSGKFAVIESAFSDTKPSSSNLLKENEEFIWADACSSATDIEIFCLVRNEKTGNRLLHHFTATKESNCVPSLHSCSIFRENAVLKSWCLNPYDLSILFLWSDGMLCSHNIKESKITELFFMKDIDTETIIAIDNVDSTLIAVAKGQPKQQECILEIWDLKCAILKTSKIFKTSSLSSIQIATVDSYVFLCFDKELMAVVFHVEDPTFYAALGMSESSTFKQHSWNTDLELIEFSSIDEPEPMDIFSANHDPLDSVQMIAEKLMNQDSPDFTCVPESELVRLLQLAIRHMKEENRDKKHFEKYLYTLLNTIFSASFSDILLIKYLKRMDLDETLASLELLLSYLNHTVCLPSDILKRPSDLQIVNWTCLIVQSHTEALLFSKDKVTRKLLKQFEKALAIKMEEYEDFDCIQSYFSIIEKKDLLPQKSSDGKYCIENIEI